MGVRSQNYLQRLMRLVHVGVSLRRLGQAVIDLGAQVAS